MSDNNEHTVAENTNEQGKPVTEGAGALEATEIVAEPTLDEALAEFQQVVKTNDTKPISTTEKPITDKSNVFDQNALKQAVQDAIAEREAMTKAAEKTKTDIDEAVKVVKGDTKVSNKIVEGFLHKKAYDNDAFRNAFLNRNQNPAGWQKVLSAAKTEFLKDLKEDAEIVDPDATQDRNAVREAVRIASTKPPVKPGIDNTVLTKMTNAELKRFKQTGDIPLRLKE